MSDAGNIVEQFHRYNSELLRLVELMDLAFAHGARSSTPDDVVIFPLLVSCRDLVEEILFVVKEGLGRAALRTARTLYECVVLARFLHLHPEKQPSFLEKFHVQWAKILQNIPLEYRSPEMHGAIASRVPKYASGKMINTKDLNWSGQHTLQMATEVGLSGFHSSAFDWASAYIHPSAALVLSTLESGTARNTWTVGERSQYPEAITAIRLAHDLILNALDLRLKCSPSDDLNQRLEQCKRDFTEIWAYAPGGL